MRCMVHNTLKAYSCLGASHEEQAMQAFALHDSWVQVLGDTVVHEHTNAIWWKQLLDDVSFGPPAALRHTVHRRMHTTVTQKKLNVTHV